MTEIEKKTLATSFIASLKTGDAKLLESITLDGVIWGLPGTNLVSGEAQGVAAIMARAAKFAAYALNLEIIHVLIGISDVVLVLHNTGRHNGKILDEHVVTVCHLDGPKIRRLDTFVSDIAMLDTYFS